MSSTAASKTSPPQGEGEPLQPMDVDHTMQEAEIQPQLDPGSVQDPQGQVVKPGLQEERTAELAIGSEETMDPRQEGQEHTSLSRELLARKHDEIDSSQAGPPEDDGQHTKRHSCEQSIQEQQILIRNEPPPSELVVAKIEDSIGRMAKYGPVVTSLQPPEHEPERKRPRLQADDDAQTGTYALKDNQRTGDAAEGDTEATSAHSDNGKDSQKSDHNKTQHSQDTARDVSALQEAAHGMKIEEEQDQPQRSMAGPTEFSSSQLSDASQKSQAEPVQVATEVGQSQSHTPSTPSQSSPTSEESSRSVVTTKVLRARRDPVKKVPKVYPPRKPRARLVSVEPLTMTIRTDSALSTLASAAVAIKNHQGPLSTLSVPPLSPTTQDAESPKVESATSPTPPEATATTATTNTTTTTTTSTASRTTGRTPTKTPVPRDASGYRCELCPGERFGRVHDLKRHQISKHNEMTWPCDFCHRPFVRRDALLRHYSVKAARKDGVHPTEQEENRLKEAKARAKLLA